MTLHILWQLFFLLTIDEYQDGCISIQIAIHIAKVVFDRTTLAMIIKKALKLQMGKVEQH